MVARIDIPGLSRNEAMHLLAMRRTMIGRCHNPNHDRFPYYGARGIEVCREWRSSTAAFIEWAMLNGYRPGLEIDRRETNGPYSPDNCRWVTHQQNACNRRKRGNATASKFKGVKRQTSGRFMASLQTKGRLIHLGTFTSETDAARAYDAAALEHFREFARLNFPQELARS